jgi:hypothetical protein
VLTVTWKLQDTELFAESVAVHVTVVTPAMNLEPEAGSQTVITQLPVVAGVGKLTAAAPAPGDSSLAVTLGGHEIVG